MVKASNVSFSASKWLQERRADITAEISYIPHGAGTTSLHLQAADDIPRAHSDPDPSIKKLSLYTLHLQLNVKFTMNAFKEQ